MMEAVQLADACSRHYGLSQMPFGLTPNTDFYVDLPSQRQAFEMLRYALSSGEGFIKVTGEVGTGKTMLCRRLLNQLDQDSVLTAYIPNPAVSAEGLWQAIAREFSLPLTSNPDTAEIRANIETFLLQQARQLRRVVLIIDEAQSMPDDTLEALRLVSNLETEKQKLIQIVLFGQPELDDKLAQPHLRQLCQRITSSSRLNPLADDESLSLYLQQRMCLAGYKGLPVFQRNAIRQLWKATQGVPRLVNIIAAKALLVGYGAGTQQLSARHIGLAIRDTEFAHKPGAVTIRWPYLLLLAMTAVVCL